MERFNLFAVHGVELEYMLVDADSLDIRPAVDQLLAKLAGFITSDAQRDRVTWSNELAAHVIEVKTTVPEPSLDGLPQLFQQALGELSCELSDLNLRLMPTAMHPWMDPSRETQLWSHENAAIYQSFHRIFNCHTHGWANVQSVHLNLPFADDSQFARLHAAVRLVLPLLPALAASSPVFESRMGQHFDSRLVHYLGHCHRAPSLIARVIPEAIYDSLSYRQQIFEPIQTEIMPLDTEGVMDVEFLNARGAIARFDRGSIEIRLMDVQEYPLADVAIVAAVSGVLRMLVDESWTAHQDQCQASTESLRALLDRTVKDAEQAVLEDVEFLRHFGVNRGAMKAGELWSVLIEHLHSSGQLAAHFDEPLRLLTAEGTLARRIHQALGRPEPNQRIPHEPLREVYRCLCDCLAKGEPFRP